MARVGWQVGANARRHPGAAGPGAAGRAVTRHGTTQVRTILAVRRGAHIGLMNPIRSVDLCWSAVRPRVSRRQAERPYDRAALSGSGHPVKRSRSMPKSSSGQPPAMRRPAPRPARCHRRLRRGPRPRPSAGRAGRRGGREEAPRLLPRPAVPDRHRPPRRQRLPARTHPRRLPARPRHGRPHRRAGPGAHQGRPSRMPSRERHHRHHRRRRPPRVHAAARPPSPSTG